MAPFVLRTCMLLHLAIGIVSAFGPSQIAQQTTLNIPQISTKNANKKRALLQLWSSPSNNDKSKKKGGLDAAVTDRLVKESISPWRPLRLFIYGSAGSGALVGGLITLSGTLAALSGARPDLDLNTELLNLGIDFGAVAAFAIAAKIDWDKGTEADAQVEKKIEQVKERKKLTKAMRQRENDLKNLLLDIQVSLDGATKTAPVRDIQGGAKQHMIIVIGPKKACRDALLGANLLKMDFSMSNVLVVPYETDVSDSIEAQIGPSKGGFADTRPVYESQPYIARPTGDGWEEYVEMELNDAIMQGGENVKEEGIAIVIASNGKVIRRGVGKVPWRQMVEQLEEEVRQ